MIVGVNHAQVNVPTADLERAREFYIGFMSLKEIARPDVFKSPGIWMNAGQFELHIGVEDNFERKTRAHVAYEVDDIHAWRKKITSAGHTIKEQPVIPGHDRFQFRDPFGNNVEIIGRVAGNPEKTFCLPDRE